MGMVVRTNTMALNAYRSLSANQNAVSKSLEKLSSGFRINRAGDDASGLSISEKMKAQIKGLEQASANAQDGISLVQTAEGALTEVHNMLNRMVELATKSANGTIQDEVDREAIQTEVDALKTEITRIAKSTNFNGIQLLDGSLGAIATQTTVAGTDGDGVAAVYTIKLDSTFTPFAAGDKITVNGTEYTVVADNAGTDEVNASDVATLDAFGNWFAGVATNDDYDVTYDSGTDTLTFTAKTPGAVGSGNGPGSAPEAPTFGSSNTGSVTFGSLNTVIAGDDGTVGTTPAQVQLDYADATGSKVIGTTLKVGDTTYEFVKTGDTTSGTTTAIEIDENATADDIAAAVAAAIGTGASAAGSVVTIPAASTGSSSVAPTVVQGGVGLTLQVGDTNADFNHVTVIIDDLTADGLGIADLDVSSQTAAGNAIEVIKNAINKVSTNRGNLGALQNRLEHTINNLDATAENMQAANSRIRDTDMAKEMMNYTKQNILAQAAQAMLAQANQQPQAILQLLQ